MIVPPEAESLGRHGFLVGCFSVFCALSRAASSKIVALSDSDGSLLSVVSLFVLVRTAAELC